MFTLQATKRDMAAGKAKAMVKAGRMPATVYGKKQEAISIEVSLHDFKKVFRDAGESSVIEVEGLAHPIQALIHEVVMDPVLHTPIHADLLAIEKGAKLEVAVPLTYVGESPAVKAGANLVKVMHELQIEADAAHLPHDLTVDISKLENIGDQIHVRDIVLPAGVVALEEGDGVVALIQEVTVEEEAPVEAVDMSVVEVEKKGKEEVTSEAE